MRKTGKLFIFAGFLVSIISTASAQITEGTRIFGGSDLLGTIIGIVNAITLVEVQTGGQLGIFLAVLGAIPGGNWFGGQGNNRQNPTADPPGGGPQNVDEGYDSLAERIDAWNEAGQSFDDLLETLREIRGIEEEEEEEEEEVEEELEEAEREARTVEQDIRELMQEEDELRDLQQGLGKMVHDGRLSEDEAEELNKIIGESEEVAEMEEKLEEFIENVLKGEEKLENLEEKETEIEEDITAKEEEIGEELEYITQEFSDLQQRIDQIKSELDQLRDQLAGGEIPPEQYDQERRQLLQQLQQVEQELQDLKERLQQIEAETEEVEDEERKAEDILEKAASNAKTVGNRISEVYEDVKTEEKEVKDEEERTKALPEGDVPKALPAVEKKEEEIAKEEEHEIRVLRDAEKGEIEVYEEEEDTLANIQNVLNEEESALARYEKDWQIMKKQIGMLKKELEQDDAMEQQQMEQTQEEEYEIKEVVKRLDRLRAALTGGNVSKKVKQEVSQTPPHELMDEVREYAQILEQIHQRGPRDPTEREMLERAEGLLQEVEEILEKQVNESGDRPEEAVKLEKLLEKRIEEAQRIGSVNEMEQFAARNEDLFGRVNQHVENFRPEVQNELRQLENKLRETIDKKSFNEWGQFFYQHPDDY